MTISDMRKSTSTQLKDLDNGDLFYIPDRPTIPYLKTGENDMGYNIYVFDLLANETITFAATTTVEVLDGELLINYKGASPYGNR